MSRFDLLPPRVQFTDANGLLTREAYRYLQLMFVRSGGVDSSSNADLDIQMQFDLGFNPEDGKNVAEALKQASLQESQGATIAELKKELATLHELLMFSPVPASLPADAPVFDGVQVGELHKQLEELREQITMLPDPSALVAELRKYQSQKIIAHSGVAAPLTGTVAKTTLATIPISGLGINGELEIWTLWSWTSSANNKTPRIELGGTAFFNPTLTTNQSGQGVTIIRNRGAANSQIGFASAAGTLGTGASGNAVVTGAVDTSTSQDLIISGQLANSGETLTLEGYTVKLTPSY